ncbi:MAG: helix-turn-helix transcriptional regulator [Oscillospiraceae bacterium]|nr:helix-turn-helix transcriptional regulator [Oscillospiraceae bacterium]
MAWYRRIRDLREDADKTQSDLAAYLGTTAQYYGKYELGERELPFSRAIELSDFYGVTLDYLAGRTSFPHAADLTAEEESVLLRWRSLSERDKGKVEFLLDTLSARTIASE